MMESRRKKRAQRDHSTMFYVGIIGLAGVVVIAGSSFLVYKLWRTEPHKK